MRIVDTEQPDAEPITVEQAKLYCRITLDADDDVLTILISSARRFVENYLQRSVAEQVKTIYYDSSDLNFACSVLELPVGPVSNVESFTVFDIDNDDTEFDTDDFFLSGDRIVLNNGIIWPDTNLRAVDAYAIEVTVGYADTDDIPKDIIQAIYKLIAHSYEHREAYFDSTDPTPLYENVPWSITALLQPYRDFTGVV